MAFASAFTSLGGCTSSQAAYAPPSRAGIISNTHQLCVDFGGPKTEASPYPSLRGVRGSAPSPPRLTGKPLVGLSWLSYSRPPDLPGVLEPGQLARFRLSPGRKLPTPATLNEPHGTCTRVALRLWSLNPVGRICTGFAPSRPALA